MGPLRQMGIRESAQVEQLATFAAHSNIKYGAKTRSGV